MTTIASSINKLFWGLLLVLLDVKINQLDILPDIIGYLIVVSGLNQLQPHSKYFLKAKILANILVFVSIAAIFQAPDIPISEFVPSNYSLLVLLFSTASGLLHIALIFFAVHGLMELAVHHNLLELSAISYNRLAIYLVFSFLALATIPFILTIGETNTIYLLLISVMIGIIMEMMILLLFRKYRGAFLTLSN